MKKIIFFLFVVNVFSQDLDYGNDITSLKICAAVQSTSFSSSTAADNALDKILNVIGASKRFVVQECGNINNAIALTFNGVRYIMYDPEFLAMLNYSDDWTNMFILAHEVGHHINGHTVDIVLTLNDNIRGITPSQSRIQELEADEFAGFALGRLGASLSQTQQAIKSISFDGDDSMSTHPNKTKRLAAAERGYKKSGGKVNDVSKGVSKGKVIDSPYSNSKYKGVKFVSYSNDNGIYEGYVSESSGKPFGYGKWRSNSGYTYEGEYVDGLENGYGVTVFSDGERYEGIKTNSEITGEGRLIKKNYVAVGSFVQGALNGDVTINFSSPPGVKEGYFIDDFPIKAKVTTQTGTEYNEGFLDGSRGNGYSTFTKLSGETITSFFQNGKLVPQLGMLAGSDGFDDTKRKEFISRRKGSITYPSFTTDFFSDFVKNNLIFYPITRPKTGDSKISFIKDFKGKRVWDIIKNKEVYIDNYTGEMPYRTTENGVQGIATPRSYTLWLDKQLSKVSGKNYVGNMLTFARESSALGEYTGYYLSFDPEKSTPFVYSYPRAGYGEFIYNDEDERLSYFGMRWDGKQNGYGILKYKNGKTEKGVFFNGKFHKAEDFDFENMKYALKRW